MEDHYQAARAIYNREYGDDLFEILEEAVFDSVVEGICTACGAYATIEPDAEFACHECEDGQVISPLLAFGLI